MKDWQKNEVRNIGEGPIMKDQIDYEQELKCLLFRDEKPLEGFEQKSKIVNYTEHKNQFPPILNSQTQNKMYTYKNKKLIIPGEKKVPSVKQKSCKFLWGKEKKSDIGPY